MHSLNTHGRRARLSRGARSLLAELSHQSHLVRHIGLCRLLHGRRLRQLEPGELECVGSRLPDATEYRSTADVIARLARLRSVEGTSGHEMQALHEAAVAALAEHGYRITTGQGRP